ncbi:MAG: hypothetical protein ACRCYA_03180 [Cetobacterium sp.]|uniref:hypothetical protein n=1 Tax=Cetobacterium sp. TaxID=2071632 RepID=UPI003F3DC906
MEINILKNNASIVWNNLVDKKIEFQNNIYKKIWFYSYLNNELKINVTYANDTVENLVLNTLDEDILKILKYKFDIELVETQTLKVPKNENVLNILVVFKNNGIKNISELTDDQFFSLQTLYGIDFREYINLTIDETITLFI